MSASSTSARPAFRDGWIFSPTVDLLVFVGPLICGGMIIGWLDAHDLLNHRFNPWLYAFLTFGVDVAHGNSTVFRTYLDPEELARRRWFYRLVPVVCYFGMLICGAISEMLFFRVLAYMAMIHFVRQQYGWVAYSNRKAGGVSPLDYRLDTLAIYNATLFPLIWWHSHVRPMGWFVPHDIVPIFPPWVGEIAAVIYAFINTLYIGRQCMLVLSGQPINRAKLLIWVTTSIVWYVSIVACYEPNVFAVMQILAHGVPYLVLVWMYGRARWRGQSGFPASLFRGWGAGVYYVMLIGIAWCEEALRDRTVMHAYPTLFPMFPTLNLPYLAIQILGPLLVLRPMMHYVFDAVIWRASSSRQLVDRLALRQEVAAARDGAGQPSLPMAHQPVEQA